MGLENFTNVTNVVQVVAATNNETNMLLMGGISAMLFIILLIGFIPAGTKNAFLGASSISLLIAIFLYFLEMIPLYLITFYVIVTVGSIIYRVFGGE